MYIIILYLIGQIWTLPGSAGEGGEPNVGEAGNRRGGGDTIHDLLDGGMNISGLALGIGHDPLPHPPHRIHHCT